jgi:hypothetical protein
MTELPRLLPPNATPVEAAIEQTIGPRDPGTETLATLDDARRVPAALLPILATVEDIPPVWPPDEGARRSLVWQAPRWHALIGTTAGIKTGARLAGAEVVALERPPSKTFLSGWTAEERAAWLRQQPQLWLKDGRVRTKAQAAHAGHDFAGACYPAQSDALARSHTRALIRWPDGRIETLTTYGWRTTTHERDATIDLARRAVAVGLMAGDPLVGFIARADASARLYRIAREVYRETSSTLWLTTVSPGLKPLSPTVDLVAERAPRPAIACAGLPLGGVHSAYSDARERLYRRIYLYDPQSAALPKHAPAMLGFTRLSSPPFVVLARVRMARRNLYSALIGSAMRLAASHGDARERIAPVLDAMDYFRAAHDKVLVYARMRRQVRASRVWRAGRITAGDIKPL